ncbi:lipase family protein [Nocardia sp. NPDC057440]|uniref:lipase family protein n=1 Tax=Nocardia sp. NPDC057440 TaxID=3346134 RepID=UPI0036729C07
MGLTTRGTLTTGLLTGVLATILIGTGTAPAVPIYPVADPDPFYAAPAGIAAKRPGEVIETRSLPPLLTFPDTDVTLVKFRSTNSRGLPIAATTTVLSPHSRPPDGPLLSYQHIINALGTKCSISRELYSDDFNLQIKEAVALNAVLLHGWSVALPDHLGPTFAYGAARLGGQITLDGIRAVRQIPELGVQHSPVAMAGYSGGGMATAWAAALAPRYAPELDIAGAAAGGVPTNMVKMLEGIQFDPHPAFGLLMAAAIGLEREYPDRFPISDYLNSQGMAARDRIANSCTNDILAAGAWRSARDFASNMSLTENRNARSVVEENSLELFDGVPKMPIFEWHSPTDPLIPIEATDNTNRRYCQAGVRLQTELTASPEHLTAAVLGIPAALAWLEARFRGEPAPTNC